jgi:hypothetical protein
MAARYLPGLNQCSTTRRVALAIFCEATTQKIGPYLFTDYAVDLARRVRPASRVASSKSQRELELSPAMRMEVFNGGTTDLTALIKRGCRASDLREPQSFLFV